MLLEAAPEGAGFSPTLECDLAAMFEIVCEDLASLGRHEVQPVTLCITHQIYVRFNCWRSGIRRFLGHLFAPIAIVQNSETDKYVSKLARLQARIFLA